jgi:NlpC/P60 family protein
MRSRVVVARAPQRVPYFLTIPLIALVATLLLLATPGRARAQAEWNIGPFLDYASIHGGHPAAAGLQTSVLVGPVGLRVSGFTALDQPMTNGSVGSTYQPRWGGDADLMLIFDFASRGSRGTGLSPYVFAGAGLAVHNPDYTTSYDPNSQLAGGWSYGGGLLLPVGGSLEAMGEIRARPPGFFNLNPSNQPTRTEIRVGLSLRLGSAFGGSGYRSTPNDPPPPPRPRRRRTGDDAIRIILGGVSEAGGATAPPASAARVIPTAEHYLGIPYRYGGTSPVTGFDCSGFVQYVFARNNVGLPRTSRQQARVGTPMPRDWRKLAPGDLVLFAERGEPISHVAIYAGHHRIIHASSSGGSVRYDDLTTPRGEWFVDHMVAARRVTPDASGLMLDLVKMLDAKSLADSALDIGDFAPRP